LSIYALVTTIFIVAAFALRVWRGIENSRLARDYIRWLRGRNTSIVRVFDEALRFPQYTNVFYRFLDEKYAGFLGAPSLCCARSWPLTVP
jgi:hypothetical protein